ncbi:chromodomain-helicase-DNA-binding protein 7 [Drosophila guanche]|uniref:Myb/SANT-like DNA-binding domain-containing protein n=1 Tax=Drosophila guanche TaxID=7266 RepID=A0A3B0JKX1_DROGU|nr:chromodomain-helicase-DNA-binding protein 7 [Drosophila guanche]XP_034127947.1 chromodomain-helicase-DNA-binding protein 7 [Drosophila guanche]SPP80972.1 Hypothetical predicted protein [Drosophila guanche]
MLMPRYMGLNDSTSSSGKNASSSSSSSGSPAITVAAHTKMRLLNKVEHNMRQSQGQSQSQNINSLISTAATGNGVVGDVDGLLMPMRIEVNHSPPPAVVPMGPGIGGGGAKSDVVVHANTRPERNLWSRPEMLEMLSIMQNINALEKLHDRNTKSEHVFRQVETIMRSKGYVKKSSIQIWTKWKFLKSTYNTTTRYGTGVPKVVPEEVYRVLCRMLGGGDGLNASGSLSECGNSMDSSKTMGEEDEMGVEHPIFGFRLGLVKPEPIDTGYETAPKDVISEPDLEAFNNEAHNRGDPDNVPHMPIIVSVKHEPEVDLGMDGTNTPPPTAPASPTPPPVSVELNADDSNHMYTPSPIMPPLRVASFAKDELKRPTHGILQIDRPPSSLGQMGPFPGQHDKGTRSMALQSTSSINFVHPTSKLMLPRKQPVRLPRDISVQPAGMRLKSVPMRETGYSLRPERMIPDLGHSISPPQSPTPPPPIYSQSVLRGPPPRYPMPSQAPSSSHQAQYLAQQQSQQQPQPQPQTRKRRNGQTPAVPVKLQRSSMGYESTPKNSRAAPPAEARSAPEDSRNSKEEQKERRKRQHEDLFTKELTLLANGMRTAQKEMLDDFFKQQRKFARSEHLFQMKQDSLVMKALRKQTDALLQVANELIGDNHAPKMEKDNRETSAEKNTEKKEDIAEEKENKAAENEDKAEENEDADADGADSENEEDDEDAEEEDEEEYDDEENMNFESEMDICTMAMSESAKSHSHDESSDGDAHSEAE